MGKLAVKIHLVLIFFLYVFRGTHRILNITQQMLINAHMGLSVAGGGYG